MKKQMIAYITIIAIVVVAAIIISLTQSDTINTQTELNKIEENFDLNILVNLGNFSKTNYDEAKLLDVAMQLAEKNSLLNEYSDESTYIQYIPKDDLHSIIKDLTGIVLESPIEIEDFYYLYDSENDYYYYRPASPSYFKVEKINSVKSNNNNYNIECLISESIDTEIVNSTNITISITSCPNNNWIKYRINKIEM